MKSKPITQLHDPVTLLLEEKKLLFQEKLQIIKTTKSIYGLLLPFLTLLVAVAEKQEARALWLIIPFATASIALFLLSNLHTQNLIYEYLYRLDYRIIAESTLDLPFYQRVVGEMFLEASAFISSKKEMLNPYVAYGIMVAIISLGISGWSIYQGDQYLVEKLGSHCTNYIFHISAALAMLYTLYAFLRYGRVYVSMRIREFDARMPLNSSQNNGA